MWFTTFDGGRVNAAQVAHLYVTGSGSNWSVYARTTYSSASSEVKLLGGFATKADGTAAIDNLILNGS